MNRLEFSIPPFLSVAWVSEEALKHWQPIFKQLNQALIDTTLSGVAQGVWNSRRIRIPGASVMKLPETAKALGLAVRSTQTGLPGEKGPVFHDVVIQLRHTSQPGDTAGIPDCCVARHNEMQGNARQESIWESAEATPGRKFDTDTITLHGGYVHGAVWHKLLVNPFSYPLCHLYCPTTLRLTTEHLEWMRAESHAGLADIWADMAHWPAEWNASHGICEMRTPVVKLAYETDATDRPFRVRFDGTAWPTHGAFGLDFPYRSPERKRMTDSQSFKNGVDLLRNL